MEDEFPIVRSRFTLLPRSGPSRKACYLRFVNRTTRNVNVLWIDYDGHIKNYGTLNPNRRYDIVTYEGHPWVCEDSVTKSRLLLNKSKIFYPKVSAYPFKNDGKFRYYLPMLSDQDFIENAEEVLLREYVHITLPVFSLLELSSEAIVRNVRSCEDIRSLRLPTLLQTMLRSFQFHP